MGVVPDVGAGALALGVVLLAALPAPETAVGLAQDGRGLEDGKVGRRRLDRLRRQVGVEEAVREAQGPSPELHVVICPIRGELVDAGKRPPYQGW